MSEIIRYMSGGTEVVLSKDIIKRYLTSDETVTDEEIFMFMKLAEAQGLNPFTRQIYLVKYKGRPASFVVGKEVFTSRAAQHPAYRGFEAGVIVQTAKGELINREGALTLKGEVLVGGWAKVFREPYKVPVTSAVSIEEYGRDTPIWRSMRSVMIRKVAMVSALREAFPDSFAGLYDASEMGITQDLPEEPIEPPTKGEVHEEQYIGQIDRAPEEQPPIEVQPGLSREQADEIWRVLKGNTELASEFCRRTGKKIEEINPKAYKKALKLAQELALSAYGQEDQEAPQNAASGEPDALDETPQEGFISPIQYDIIFEAIKSKGNRKELQDSVLQLFNIRHLAALNATDFDTAMNYVDDTGIPF